MNTATTKTVTIHGLAAGGDAVGRDDDGRVVFVRRGAPGDRANVTLTREKKGFAFGEIESLETQSPVRVEPRCSVFNDSNCGGCQWQHINRKHQLSAKHKIVQDALRKLTDKVEAPSPKTPEFRWRRKVRLHWTRERKQGRADIGFFASQSHKVIPFTTCVQLSQPLEVVVKDVASELAPSLTKTGEIEIVVGQEGFAHVAIHGPCKISAAKELLSHSKIVGVKLGKRLFGESTVALPEGGRAGGQHFVQASAEGNQALRVLVDKATEQRVGDSVLELYAGGGNLTQTLCVGAKQVVAIDTNIAKPCAPNVQTIRGDVGGAVEELLSQMKRFDWIVLDPPRVGAKGILEKLVAFQPKGIIYVSCNPATLARDCESVAEKYRLETVTVLDMMPQTCHVEVIASLQPV